MIRPDSFATSAAILGSALLVITWLRSFFAQRKNPPLPPGPKGWPIIGNVLDLPSKFQWFKYTEWTKQYGT